MNPRKNNKEYNIEWSFTKDFNGNKQFICKCTMIKHSEVESFTCGVTEDRGYVSGLKYYFNVNNVTVRSKNDSNCLNAESTCAIQKSVVGYFHDVKMNDHSSYSCVSLEDATKEKTINCAKALFRNLNFDKEDEGKIIEFLMAGIISHQELLSQIVDLVLKGNVQGAYDKALLSEQHGYKGMMYQLGEIFLDKNHVQPAYIVMSEVPKTDFNYTKAQITAAKLAASPDVSFPDKSDRIKAIFSHCQNAGQDGQSYIDNYFRKMTKLPESEEHLINDVKGDVETLTRFAEIIAGQSDEIKRLKKKLSKAKERKREATGCVSPFWSREQGPVVEVIEVINTNNQMVTYSGKGTI